VKKISSPGSVAGVPNLYNDWGQWVGNIGIEELFRFWRASPPVHYLEAQHDKFTDLSCYYFPISQLTVVDFLLLTIPLFFICCLWTFLEPVYNSCKHALYKELLRSEARI